MKGLQTLMICGLTLLSPRLQGGVQDSLTAAAERVRRAWLAHDAAAIVSGSPGVTLRIPGADPSAAITAGQAAELVRRYLQPAVERSVDAASVREVEVGQGFVELVRRYVVRGTTEAKEERVYLGLKKDPQGRWVVTELRAGR